jgi:hypothetical protein
MEFRCPHSSFRFASSVAVRGCPSASCRAAFMPRSCRVHSHTHTHILYYLLIRTGPLGPCSTLRPATLPSLCSSATAEAIKRRVGNLHQTTETASMVRCLPPSHRAGLSTGVLPNLSAAPCALPCAAQLQLQQSYTNDHRPPRSFPILPCPPAHPPRSCSTTTSPPRSTPSWIPSRWGGKREAGGSAGGGG